jgi:hypothetical protein
MSTKTICSNYQLRKIPMKRFKLLALAVATAVVSQPIAMVITAPAAIAQYINPFTGGMWNNPISSSADTAILNNVYRRMLNPGSSGATPTPSAEQPTLVAQPLTASSFSPVAASLMPQRFAAEHAINPRDQQELAQLYTELLQSYDAMLIENGEQRLKNNVAGAMVYLILTSSFVLTDGEEMSDAMQEELLQDFNAALAVDARFQSLSAQDKQVLYETFVISGGLALALYVQGYEQGDADLVQQAQELALIILNDVVGLPLDAAAAPALPPSSGLVGAGQPAAATHRHNLDA